MEDRIDKQEFIVLNIFTTIASKMEDIVSILNWLSFEFIDLNTFLYYFLLLLVLFIVTSIEKMYKSRGKTFSCKTFSKKK